MCYLLKISPSYAIAVSISGPLLTVFSVTGGLYTNIKMIPESVRWVQYFSWYVIAKPFGDFVQRSESNNFSLIDRN